MLGGYSGVPTHDVTVLQGIRDRVGRSASRSSITRAARSRSAGPGSRTRSCRAIPQKTGRHIAEAVKVAAQADVVVLAIGDNEQTSREAWALNHLGDRASLDLVGVQDELVDAIAATGKPIVALLFNGRPLSIRNLAEKAAAILECWYLGQESGPRRGRGPLRRHQPRRQAADHDPPLGRPHAGLLQLQALGPARLPLRRCDAAVRLRLRPQLHAVPPRERAPGEVAHRHRRIDARCWSR